MRKQRDSGVELLRIIAMLLIIIGHCLGDDLGSVLSKVEFCSLNYYVLWLMEAYAVVGTNCFVLISGYYLPDSNISYRKILKLWGLVFFYSIVTYVISVVIGINTISIKALITALLPVLNRNWWFVSVYFCLYLLSPFLNRYVSSTTTTELRKLVIILLVLFSVVPIIFPIKDTFSSGGGTGIVWFITLYFIAVYIRRIEDNIKLSSKALAGLFVILIFAMFTSKIVIAHVTSKMLGSPMGTSLLYQNNSVLNVCAATMLFLALKKVNFTRKVGKAICYIASFSFSVYLIHNTPFLNRWIWKVTEVINLDNIGIAVVQIIVISILLYLSAMMIELLRRFLVSIIIKGKGIFVKGE